MTTIALHGYYGYRNAGDEALLRAIASDLRAIRPDARLVVLSADPAWTTRVHGLPAVHRFNPVAVTALLAKSDLFILGGGTLLQDATSVRSVAYYSFITRLAHRLGCRVMLYANGLGPLRTPRGRRAALLALAAADRITLRDRDSLDLYEELLGTIDPAKVAVTADPAFGLGVPAEGADDPAAHRGVATAELPAPGSYALYVFRPWSGVEDRVEDLAIAARAIADEHHIKPIFLAMHPSHDRALAKDLATRAGAGARAIAPDPSDTGTYLDLLRGAGFIVSMRLHALVMAAAVGQSAVAISYDPKVDAAAKQLDMPLLGHVETLPPLKELVASLGDAVRTLPERRAHLRDRLPAIQQLARRNARIASELLAPRQSGQTSVL